MKNYKKSSKKTLNTSSKKDAIKPNLSLDMFEIKATDVSVCRSVLQNKDISLKFLENLEPGFYAVSAKNIENGHLTKTARPLKLHTPPLEGFNKYLSSSLFKGIGIVSSNKIVEKFGMELFQILEKEESEIQNKLQINENISRDLAKSWLENKKTALFDILLNELSFSSQQQTYIKNEYGLALLYTLRTNPLSLLGDIPFLTFPDIEKMCDRLKFDLSDQQKIIATTNHLLRKFEISRGETCTPIDRLMDEVKKIIPLDIIEIENTIKSTEKVFKISERGKKIVVATQASYERDLKIISEIKRIRKTNIRTKQLKEFFKNELKVSEGVDLSDEQMDAINKAINSPISIITGGPGAGKTTMVRGLVSALKLLKLSIKISAPTGKAAKRISAEGLKSFNPSTIHSYLGKFGEKTDKTFDFMIVDESSMIDINLMQELLESIPDKTSIVFIGDADQLPPVGPGQAFKDLIESEKIPVVKLTGNYRQHLMSGISKAARLIVKGKKPELTNNLDNKDFCFLETPLGEQATKILDLYFNKFPKLLNVDLDKIQILSPMRDGEAGVNNLNYLIQQRLTANTKPLFTLKNKNSDINFYAGDKIIMRKNKVKELGLVNGDIGILVRKSGNQIITEFEDKGEVRFKLNQVYDLELAYAITIHLSQGSDYPGVIIPCSSEHNFMLKKNLIYTALTRGKDKVCIVGEEKSFSDGIQKGWMDFRYTNLVELTIDSLTR